jgi:hypothetical protein
MKIKRFLKYIYPVVRQDKRWHRIVKVVGWTISIISLTFFPLVFVIYFGVIQRAIFYIVYGEDKDKWLLEKPFE